MSSQQIKPQKQVLTVANIDTGEVGTLINYKHVTKSNAKFIKVFDLFIEHLDTFNKSELIVLKYLFKTIKPNQIKVYLSSNDFTNISKSNYHKTIKSLIDKSIIMQGNYKNQFLLNVNAFYNGKLYK